MKTISIKNGLFWSGVQRLRVTVNGEEHIMKTHMMNVEVDENIPLEISVKRGWSYSPAYNFEPKDNLLLRISQNPQMTKRIIFLFILGLVLFPVLGYFTEIKRLFSLTPCLMWVFPIIYMMIRRKEYFDVQEAN